MALPNIKVYLIISGLLIVLFLIVTFVPFGKRGTNNQQPSTIFPTPTLFEVNQSPITNPPAGGQIPTIKPADFTGAKDEELPSETAKISLQKQDLRNKVPLNLSTFSIDFDYSEDKFVVTLKEPKDQVRSEFENWRTSNYPSLSTNQFNFK
ncbi:MAG: hypothetical protein V1803_02675 [Candidatus Roizmanbacteria bacterium]